MGPILLEVRLPEDQLQTLATLVAQQMGGGGVKENYTADEAAQKMNVHVTTIRRWIEAGRLKTVPGIRKTLVTAESLDKARNG